jgi:hypothetical protein
LLDRSLERLDRVLTGALADQGEGVVDDPLGKLLLAVAHHLVDQLLDEPVAEARVGLDRSDGCSGAAWH